jgi:hypothetical protein
MPGPGSLPGPLHSSGSPDPPVPHVSTRQQVGARGQALSVSLRGSPLLLAVWGRATLSEGEEYTTNTCHSFLKSAKHSGSCL